MINMKNIPTEMTIIHPLNDYKNTSDTDADNECECISETGVKI